MKNVKEIKDNFDTIFAWASEHCGCHHPDEMVADREMVKDMERLWKKIFKLYEALAGLPGFRA